MNTSRLKFLFSFILIVSFTLPSFGQYCSSIGHDNSSDWIEGVQINLLNNTSGQDANGYGNYTSQIDSFIQGETYPLKVIIGGNFEEYVDVWIDFNQNDTLETSEKIASLQGEDSVSGNFTVPLTADTGNTRLRIILNYSQQTSNPCVDSLQFGEAEDYTIRVDSNKQSPTAQFTSDTAKITTCRSTVHFTDLTDGVPTSWYWDFGDGDTSMQQNPTHTYAGDSTNYTVTLIVNNANGADTITKTNYITVLQNSPKQPNCTPYTNDTSFDIGIYEVDLQGIYRLTTAPDEAYRDFSCYIQDTLKAGINYNVYVQTSEFYEEDVTIWVDYNNDGSFTNGEVLFNSSREITSHSGTVQIPQSVTYNQLLRMRVSSDYYAYNTPDPCYSNLGQTEDYGIVITQNNQKPEGDFTADKTYVCYNDPIQFTATTENFPSSYFWTFGDGNFSTSPNPTHTYTDTGTYTVSLELCNSQGCTTITKQNYIIKDFGPKAPSSSCIPNTNSSTGGVGIFKVSLWDIDHRTFSAQSEGYLDLACDKHTQLIEGATYDFYVETGSVVPENVRVWIDYNNNGTFSSGEIIFSSDSNYIYHEGTVTISTSATTNKPLRMRVISNTGDQAMPAACSNVTDGQGEDYAVTILPNDIPPIANFTYDDPYSKCDGTVYFTEKTVNEGNTWLWKFGDGDTDTSKNPKHVYDEPGTYNVTLIATNSFGSDTIKKKVTVKFTFADFKIANPPVIIDSPVTFNNKSVQYDTLEWNFGDGSKAFKVKNPQHTYTSTGSYNVRLLVIDTSTTCFSQITQTIDVVTGIAKTKDNVTFHVYPTLTRDIVYLEFNSDQPEPIHLKLTNILGEVIYEQNYLSPTQPLEKTFQLGDQAPGLYFLSIQQGAHQYVRKINVE